MIIIFTLEITLNLPNAYPNPIITKYLEKLDFYVSTNIIISQKPKPKAQIPIQNICPLFPDLGHFTTTSIYTLLIQFFQA